MTHQSPAFAMPAMNDAGRQVAQLRHVLTLVEQIAGRPDRDQGGDAALDESARISGAYDDAVPIVQRRFDALIAETALWAAAGVEALLAANSPDRQSQGAAAALAHELARALRDIARVLRL